LAESRNVQVTRALYRAVPAGDAETVVACMHPEVEITYYGTDAIPYAGTYRGSEGVGRFLEAVAASVEVVEMEPKLFIEQGDHLAVWGSLLFRTKRRGREFRSDFAHIITLRDAKWYRFRDFANSALAAQIFEDEGK